MPDKETVHTVIEILTTILLPLLTYYVRNTAKDVVMTVTKSMNDAINDIKLDIERRLGSISAKDAASGEVHANTDRRLNALERGYNAIQRTNNSQTMILNRIADKLDVKTRGVID